MFLGSLTVTGCGADDGGWVTAVAFGDGGVFALIMVKGQYGLDII